jgi:pyrimidine operon attenuation protein/uracil phosphoribosyltransferase
MDSQTNILNHQQVCAILRRIAFQIAESHVDSNTLVLVGMNERGQFLTHFVAKELAAVLPSLNMIIHEVNAEAEIALTESQKQDICDQAVIVIDDVINSGRSVARVVAAYFQSGAKSIQTAFLAEREYRNYPISANWVGRSVATTLQDHVYFDNSNPDSLRVYLAN